jgi:hypothetical protein
MERSELQEVAAASRFDAHTTYNTSVGSAQQGQLSREINRMPGAGAPSIQLAKHIDLSNGAPETVDWAGNPAPQWRRKHVDELQHRDSLRYDGGFLVSGKGGDADFRPSRKVHGTTAFHRADGQTEHCNNKNKNNDTQQNQSPAQKKAAARWVSNSRASWGAELGTNSRTSDSQERRSEDETAASWKSSYQLMAQAQSSSMSSSETPKEYVHERDPVGRSKPYRPCRKLIGPSAGNAADLDKHRRQVAASLTRRDDSGVVRDASASMTPRETYNMPAMRGDQLLAGIDSAALARAVQKGTLPTKSQTKSQTSESTTARRHVPRPNTWQRTRLPGFSFD